LGSADEDGGGQSGVPHKRKTKMTLFVPTVNDRVGLGQTPLHGKKLEIKAAKSVSQSMGGGLEATPPIGKKWERDVAKGKELARQEHGQIKTPVKSRNLTHNTEE